MNISRREFFAGASIAGAFGITGCASFLPRRHDGDTTVFISDVHVHADGHQLGRFATVVDEILRMSPLPKNVVCFGDIAYLRT